MNASGNLGRIDAVRVGQIAPLGPEGVPSGYVKQPVTGPVQVGGLHFPNPIGIAAGFDKDARVVAGLALLGGGDPSLRPVTRGLCWRRWPVACLLQALRDKRLAAGVDRQGRASTGAWRVMMSMMLLPPYLWRKVPHTGYAKFLTHAFVPAPPSCAFASCQPAHVRTEPLQGRARAW